MRVGRRKELYRGGYVSVSSPFRVFKQQSMHNGRCKLEQTIGQHKQGWVLLPEVHINYLNNRS